MLAGKDRDRVCCEIVAQLVIADATVTDQERALLDRLMEDFGLDEQDRRAVYGSVDIGKPIDARLALLDEGAKVELLVHLERVAAVDGHISRGEAQIIDQVRAALGR